MNPIFEIPRILQNRYQLVRLAGTGGISAVFEAMDTVEDRTVAVKILLRRDGQPTPPDQVQHFLAGARFGLQFSHPHLVRTLDFGEDSELGPFWVMDFLAGESLSRHITGNRELSEFFIRSIGAQIASCLKTIHERNMLHGDIKPENIFLTPGPQEPWIIVLDFVPMRRLDDWLAMNVTREYLPPEIFSGGMPNAGADAFALGVLLHELTFGVLPMFHQSGELNLPLERRTISPKLAAFLFGLLSFSPRDRLLTLGDLANSVVSAEGEAKETTIRTPEPGPAPPFNLQAAFSQHPFGMLFLDTKMVVTWVNESARKWLGDGLIGQRFHVTPLAFFSPQILGNLEDALETGRITSCAVAGTSLYLWISPVLQDQIIQGIVCTLCPSAAEMHFNA